MSSLRKIGSMVSGTLYAVSILLPRQVDVSAGRWGYKYLLHESPCVRRWVQAVCNVVGSIPHADDGRPEVSTFNSCHFT